MRVSFPLFYLVILLLTACEFDNPFDNSDDSSSDPNVIKINKVSSPTVQLSGETRAGFTTPSISYNERGDGLAIWYELGYSSNQKLFYRFFDGERNDWNDVQVLNQSNGDRNPFDKAKIKVVAGDFILTPGAFSRELLIFDSEQQGWFELDYLSPSTYRSADNELPEVTEPVPADYIYFPDNSLIVDGESFFVLGRQHTVERTDEDHVHNYAFILQQFVKQGRSWQLTESKTIREYSKTAPSALWAFAFSMLGDRVALVLQEKVDGSVELVLSYYDLETGSFSEPEKIPDSLADSYGFLKLVQSDNAFALLSQAKNDRSYTVSLNICGLDIAGNCVWSREVSKSIQYPDSNKADLLAVNNSFLYLESDDGLTATLFYPSTEDGNQWLNQSINHSSLHNYLGRIRQVDSHVYVALICQNQYVIGGVGGSGASSLPVSNNDESYVAAFCESPQVVDINVGNNQLEIERQVNFDSAQSNSIDIAVREGKVSVVAAEFDKNADNEPNVTLYYEDQASEISEVLSNGFPGSAIKPVLKQRSANISMISWSQWDKASAKKYIKVFKDDEWGSNISTDSWSYENTFIDVDGNVVKVIRSNGALSNQFYNSSTGELISEAQVPEISDLERSFKLVSLDAHNLLVSYQCKDGLCEIFSREYVENQWQNKITLAAFDSDINLSNLSNLSVKQYDQYLFVHWIKQSENSKPGSFGLIYDLADKKTVAKRSLLAESNIFNVSFVKVNKTAMVVYSVNDRDQVNTYSSYVTASGEFSDRIKHSGDVVFSKLVTDPTNKNNIILFAQVKDKLMRQVFSVSDLSWSSASPLLPDGRMISRSNIHVLNDQLVIVWADFSSSEDGLVLNYAIISQDKSIQLFQLNNVSLSRAEFSSWLDDNSNLIIVWSEDKLLEDWQSSVSVIQSTTVSLKQQGDEINEN